MNAGCAGKTVRSLENTCHTWVLKRCDHDKALYKSTFKFTFALHKISVLWWRGFGETWDKYSPCEWALLNSFSGSEVKGQGHKESHRQLSHIYQTGWYKCARLCMWFVLPYYCKTFCCFCCFRAMSYTECSFVYLIIWREYCICVCVLSSFFLWRASTSASSTTRMAVHQEMRTLTLRVTRKLRKRWDVTRRWCVSCWLMLIILTFD